MDGRTAGARVTVACLVLAAVAILLQGSQVSRPSAVPVEMADLVDPDGVAYQRQVNRTPFEFATLEPKWDVSFFMGATDLNLRQTKLRFEVLDYDQWSADDQMGVAEFPLVVFDPDEQLLIRRAAKWRSKKRREARARARGDAVSPAPSPAFLPGAIGGLLRTSSAVKREREEDARFGGSGTLDVDGESDGESDEAESDLTDPDSQTPSRSSPAGRGSPKKASYFKRLVRGSNELTAVHSVKDFGAAFNKDRKSQARMLMRAGVFGLDKPLVQQNGERVGEMCWYSRNRAYGELAIVYNDGFSRFSQEAGALMRQAGSFVSMAAVGKTVKTLGVGDFLSSKVEAAVDVGKRRAVNIVEAQVRICRVSSVGGSRRTPRRSSTSSRRSARRSTHAAPGRRTRRWSASTWTRRRRRSPRSPRCPPSRATSRAPRRRASWRKPPSRRTVPASWRRRRTGRAETGSFLRWTTTRTAPRTGRRRRISSSPGRTTGAGRRTRRPLRENTRVTGK